LADWLYEVAWVPEHSAEATGTVRPGGTWLLLADASGVGTQLARRLEAKGHRCVLRFAHPTEPDGSRAIGPADREALGRLVRELAAGRPPLQGVVHLWNLDAPAAATWHDAARRQRAQELGCTSLLYLAQALLEAQMAHLPRLVLVTRAVQRIAPDPHPVAVAQAPAWGLARTLESEHPELGCRRSDLGEATWAGELDALESLALREGPEEIERTSNGYHRARRRRAQPG
jgi:hypothetical protein